MNTSIPFDPSTFSMENFDPSMFSMERLAQYGEQVLDANREALRVCLEAYEKALESIASFQEQAASRTDIEWVASAAKAQANLTRELARQQVSMGRQFPG
jgi:uncharacterized membrane protein